MWTIFDSGHHIAPMPQVEPLKRMLVCTTPQGHQTPTHWNEVTLAEDLLNAKPQASLAQS